MTSIRYWLFIRTCFHTGKTILVDSDLHSWFEKLPVIVTCKKRILSVTHEIVPDSDRWPEVISCTVVISTLKDTHPLQLYTRQLNNFFQYRRVVSHIHKDIHLFDGTLCLEWNRTFQRMKGISLGNFLHSPTVLNDTWYGILQCFQLVVLNRNISLLPPNKHLKY